MKLRNIVAVALSVSILFTTPSHAASTDFIDNGSYTTDTISSLDWLDVTTSLNQSYSYINTQFGLGGEYEGWSYATRTNFLDMVSNYTDVSKSTHLEGFVDYSNQELNGLWEMLGATTYEFLPSIHEMIVIEGYVKDDSSDLTHLASMLIFNDLHEQSSSQSSYVVNGDGGWADFEYPYFGSFLVRNTTLIATPIPAAAFLFAPALLGFLGLRRRIKI